MFSKEINPADLRVPPSKEEIKSLNDRFRAILPRMPKAERRLPLVVEFIGPPKAFKTTIRDMIAKFLDRSGLSVIAPPEGASLEMMRPLRENLLVFNTATATYALEHLLRACYPANKHQLALFDRGIIDSQCWFQALLTLRHVDERTEETVRNFFALDAWSHLVSCVVLLHCNPAISTERGNVSALAYEERLATSTHFLETLGAVYKSKEWHKKLRLRPRDVLEIETSDPNLNLPRLALHIAGQIAEMLESAVDPEYATIPSQSVSFEGFRSATDPVASHWSRQVEYRRKHDVETDPSRKQVVAVGFVQIGDKVFRAQRSGDANRPELRSKWSICIGGHVERLDSTNGEGLEEKALAALRRELREELIFDGDPEVELMGWVNEASTEAGMHHVAAVHRVTLPEGRLRIRPGVLDQEFGEKSWAMLESPRLKEDAAKFDPWSQIIIEHFFGGPKYRPSGQMRLPTGAPRSS